MKIHTITNNLYTYIIRLLAVLVLITSCSIDMTSNNMMHDNNDNVNGENTIENYRNAARQYSSKNQYTRLERLEKLSKKHPPMLRSRRDIQLRNELTTLLTTGKESKKNKIIRKKNRVIRKYNLEKRGTPRSPQEQLDYEKLCVESRSLKDYDQVSSDEEIICESLNIPVEINNERFYCLGNSIHKDFATYCNAATSRFYMNARDVNNEKLLNMQLFDVTEGYISDLYNFWESIKNNDVGRSSPCGEPNECTDCRNFGTFANFIKEIGERVATRNYGRDFNGSRTSLLNYKRCNHVIKKLNNLLNSRNNNINRDTVREIINFFDWFTYTENRPLYLSLSASYSNITKNIERNKKELLTRKSDALSKLLLKPEETYETEAQIVQTLYADEYRENIYGLNDVINYEEHRVSTIPYEWYNVTTSNRHRMLNLAMARLTFVRNDTQESLEPFSFDENDQVTLERDSEQKIFRIARREIEQNFERCIESKYIVLDLHTYLSMCEPCRKEARNFIISIRKLLIDNVIDNPDKIRLRVSYTKKYKNYSDNFNVIQDLGSTQTIDSLRRQNNNIDFNNYIIMRPVEFMKEPSPLSLNDRKLYDPTLVLSNLDPNYIFPSGAISKPIIRSMWDSMVKSLRGSKNKQGTNP